MVDIIELYIGRENIKTIIEAGALNCEDSIALTLDYPNAHVHAFECNPDSIQVCKKNIKGNPRITLTEKALTDTEGITAFFPIDTKSTITTHADGNPGASSLFLANADYPAETYVQDMIMVPTITLEVYCKEKGIDSIDLLWLDAQGAELSILKGLGEMIHDVKVVKTEVLFKEQYLGAPLFDEVVDFLESKGFRFVRFITKYEWFGDILMINENLK